MATCLLPKCHSLDLKEFRVPIPEDVWEVGNGYRWGHMQYILTFIPLLQKFTWILQKLEHMYNINSN
jgi:hypothetical protein